MTEPNPEGLYIEPLLTRPEKVAIVCLGPSMNDFVREAMTTAKLKNPYDEVWTLNRGLAGIKHDKLFALDDLRWLSLKDNAYGSYLQRSEAPIITSTVYPEFPKSVAYPYAEVQAKLGDDIFNVNTVAYMVGYAILTEVKELSIFGADFFYPNGSTAESGGQAVAYLLGMCKFFGVQPRIPPSSCLLYVNTIRQKGMAVERPPYGYHRKDEVAKLLKEHKQRKAAEGNLYTPPEELLA